MIATVTIEALDALFHNTDYVYMIDDDIVGFDGIRMYIVHKEHYASANIWIYNKENKIYISDLWVSPDMRMLGNGRIMLNLAHRIADIFVKRYSLMSFNVLNNTKILDWYKKEGYDILYYDANDEHVLIRMI